MAERDRIARYFAPLTAAEPDAYQLTDDAALLTPPPGQQLVVTTDSVIENIHILSSASPAQYAQKLLRRNLSDLAAMGATPWRYFLNLHTPNNTPDSWFAAFATALAKEQQRFALTLAGGDSTSGGTHFHLTLTCIGLLDSAPLRRNGAMIDDDIYVSGTLGDAALALELLRTTPAAISEADLAYLTARYYTPEPRLALGNALRHLATAAIDISDGLLTDANQVCSTSQIGMTLQRALLPLSQTARAFLSTHETAILTGGDDYELLFTASPTARAMLQSLATTLDLPLTRIGQVTPGASAQLLDTHGNPMRFSSTGFEHR